MSNTVMPTDGFYKYLAQRIITQAIKDYQEAIDKKNGKLRADVESFIKSKWFDQVADTAGFGYCDFTARGKKRFLSRIKQNYYLKKTICQKNRRKRPWEHNATLKCLKSG